jgi:hypothetical protein
VAEFSDVLKSFGVSEVVSDRYAGEWVVEAFRECGIAVKPSEYSASEIYLEALPLISNGTAELLDIQRLAGQLTGLERRTRSGGRDLVTHYPGGHDDVCNSACGALVGAEIARTAGGHAFFGVIPNVWPVGSGYADGDEGLDEIGQALLRAALEKDRRR